MAYADRTIAGHATLVKAKGSKVAKRPAKAAGLKSRLIQA
jgi:hypothetical protein